MSKDTKLGLFHHRATQDSRILELEAEVQYLQEVVRYQADIIAKLQWRADPYTQDGDSLYNSFWQKGMD